MVQEREPHGMLRTFHLQAGPHTPWGNTDQDGWDAGHTDPVSMTLYQFPRSPPCSTSEEVRVRLG